MTAFADSEVEFYDLDGVWGSYRLLVDNEDVTTFRDTLAQIGSYQLTEPYGYGPATFAFPQLTPFDRADWGTGDLSWMGNGKRVKLVQVDGDGSLVRTVWEGVITRPNITDDGTTIACDGLASGRLARRIKTSGMFMDRKPAGRKIFDAFDTIGLRVTPFLGGDYGPKVSYRGLHGWMIDYVDDLLASTRDTDGSCYTVMPTDDGKWLISKKDTTTVDFTVHYGAHGVKVDLAEDLTEDPTSVYGSGIAPSGLVWSNAKHPNAIQGTAPDYPMTDDSAFSEGTTDADTDSGDGVTVMIKKLGGSGYLPRSVRPGGYDSDATRAIKDLQEDAGLTTSGNMNTATWDALFDVSTAGVKLTSSYIAPLAQKGKVRKFNRTSNGTISGLNDNYDPSVEPVDVFVDYGPDCTMPRARRNARGIIARGASSNLAGTVTLSSDVFAGDHTHGDTDPTQLSRLDINAGDNCYLKNVSDDLLHVSVVNVSGDLTVTLGVDARARDAAELSEVIARRIESRQNPARQWKRQHRTGVNFRKVEASEDFGVLFNKVSLTGDEWNIVEILAGDAGNVSRVRIETSSSATKFCVAFFAENPGKKWLTSKVGNPFDSNADGESKWTNAGVQKALDRDRSLLAAFGDDAQPGGYHPRSHSDADGVTDAPITGLLLEDAGFDYHTFRKPVIYMAIYPADDTVLKQQRILWAVEESDA